MQNITELIPADILHQFLRQQMKCKLVVVAVSGPHAYGYPNPGSPLELKGIHVEPTEHIVSLINPPMSHNWVGDYQGFLIDYSTLELGESFQRLLRGDGSILERILATRQMLKGEDLRRLQKVTRGVICRRFFNYYKSFAKGLTRDFDEEMQVSVKHILGIYRQALTGIHLLNTGKVRLDLISLAKRYRLARIQQLVDTYQDKNDAVLQGNDPWINRIVKLHTLFEEAVTTSSLSIDPDNPGGLEEYLLDMRRRFFDAPTIEQ